MPDSDPKAGADSGYIDPNSYRGLQLLARMGDKCVIDIMLKERTAAECKLAVFVWKIPTDLPIGPLTAADGRLQPPPLNFEFIPATRDEVDLPFQSAAIAAGCNCTSVEIVPKQSRLILLVGVFELTANADAAYGFTIVSVRADDTIKTPVHTPIGPGPRPR
jgi:hypothetical protein